MENATDINWEEVYTGFKGRLIIMVMNLYHRKVHLLFSKAMSIEENDMILDVGCGGGGLLVILARKTNEKITGIDYSANMVRAAIKKNSKRIKNNRISVFQASVSKLPFDDNSFDKITAFETIHFWPSIADDLIEVRRALKPGGSLHIMNRVPKKESKWYDFVKFKTPEECRISLEKAGYLDIEISTKLKRNWVYATASKS
jgi:ubiquinone/menaquinone biosynthesis C-methylase UbiE